MVFVDSVTGYLAKVVQNKALQVDYWDLKIQKIWIPLLNIMDWRENLVLIRMKWRASEEQIILYTFYTLPKLQSRIVFSDLRTSPIIYQLKTHFQIYSCATSLQNGISLSSWPLYWEDKFEWLINFTDDHFYCFDQYIFYKKKNLSIFP